MIIRFWWEPYSVANRSFCLSAVFVLQCVGLSAAKIIKRFCSFLWNGFYYWNWHCASCFLKFRFYEWKLSTSRKCYLEVPVPYNRQWYWHGHVCCTRASRTCQHSTKIRTTPCLVFSNFQNHSWIFWVFCTIMLRFFFFNVKRAGGPWSFSPALARVGSILRN